MFKKLPITLLLLLLATNTIAQSGEPASSTQESGEPINANNLRAETQQLEQDMYKLFNELNSRNDFDVACGHKEVTGSTIPVWKCEAAFMRDAQAKNVSDRFDNQALGSQFGNAPASSKQLTFRSRAKEKQLNDEMKSLALEHPELAAAMLALHAKRQQLAQLDTRR